VQVLFDPHVVKAVHGEKSVTVRGQVFMYKGWAFKHGFVSESFPLSHFFPNAAIPTIAELNQFQSHPEITLCDVGLAYLQRIVPDDNIKVVAGQLKGLVGRALQCEADSVVVEYLPVGDTHPHTVTLKPRDVRKRFSVGDLVQVIFGQHTGIIGWVTGEVEMVSGEDKGNPEVIKDRETFAGLSIYDDKNSQSVRLF
jgi:transcription elongation factor